MRALAAAGIAILLAACQDAAMSPPPGMSAAVEAVAPAEMAREEKMAADAPAAAGGGEGGAPSQAAPNATLGAPMLAYAYSTTLELPSRAVVETMKAHEKACAEAGPRLCQVVGSQTVAETDQYITANLSIRAEPNWLKTFRGSLGGDAKKAGGRIKSENVYTEDLTRQIVDAEAQLRAQKTLRDRLQQILRERPGKLGELLETERELARVQGEIDARESVLAVMRARVSMSTLDLSYQSKATAVTGGTFEPVSDAVTSFARVVAQGLGAIITLVAFLLPWLIVIVPLVWLVRRWLGRRKARKAATPAL
jgi:hypothetical protein